MEKLSRGGLLSVSDNLSLPLHGGAHSLEYRIAAAVDAVCERVALASHVKTHLLAVRARREIGQLSRRDRGTFKARRA